MYFVYGIDCDDVVWRVVEVSELESFEVVVDVDVEYVLFG